MGEPHVEMRQLHDNLTANHRGELYKAELKTRWLEQSNHQGGEDDHFKYYAANDPEFITLHDSLARSAEASFERWPAEELITSQFNKLDDKLKLRDTFADAGTWDAFEQLKDVFPDAMLTGGESIYALIPSA